MIKIILKSTLLFMFWSSLQVQGQTYSGGSGTTEDPYQIATKYDLRDLSTTSGHWGLSFIQTADIKLLTSDFDNGGIFYNSGAGFSPIGTSSNRFTGSYGGQGFIIDGLVINRTTTDNIGLFGYTAPIASIQNIGVTNANISGQNYVGGLVGNTNGTTINKCFTTGLVSGSNNYVGGLIGNNYNSTINNCYSTAAISGNAAVAGLVGDNDNGTINNCYSTGYVSSGGAFVGGLVGRLTPGNTFANNSFWDSQTSEQSTSGGGTGKTTSQMKSLNTFTSSTWDFIGETANGTADIWTMGPCNIDGSSYPILSWQVSTLPSAPVSSDQIFCPGATVQNLTATGTSLQWYNLSGGGTALTNSATLSTGTYYVSQSTGCESSRTSVGVTIANSTQIATQPVSSTVCSGIVQPFTISATGTNVTYAWSTGDNTASISTSTAGVYLATATGLCGTVTFTPVSLTVNELTQIATQPVTATVCSGKAQSFTVSATGTNITYAWSNGANTASISTSTTGVYFATATGVCGTVIFNPTSLSIYEPTTLISVPISQIVNPGSTANLTISATGNNISYVWSNAATTPGITVGAGNYTVTASGSCRRFMVSVSVKEIATVTIAGLNTNGDAINSATGTQATLSGLGIVNGATVSVNGIALGNATLIGNNMLVIYIPAGVITSSTANIVIQNPNQVPSTPITITVVNVTTGLQSLALDSTFKLYPNPLLTGELTIEKAELGVLYIYNAQGLEVYSTPIYNSTIQTISTPKLTSGVYMVKVGNKWNKLVVE